MSAPQIRYQCLCFCDGQQEALYLKHLAKLLKTDSRRVTFTLKEMPRKNNFEARGIAYDKAALFDHDNKPELFKEKLNACAKSKCFYAYSNLDFDLWLLLHKRDFAAPVHKNDAYVQHVRDSFALDEEADIKNAAIMADKILPGIALSDVKDAIRRADKIRAHKLPSDALQTGTIKYFHNPDLHIHEFIKKVFAECGEPIE
ncbi:MAG: RloB family protein [Clostridiales bacterium]|jgi:hypothetical protein|nr:RloB family protein [Clostridiales bacterium]